MEFRQLLPEPGTVEVGELLGSMRVDAPPGADRPYTLVNFVSSADGRSTLGGRSGQLGDDGDRAMFHGLREHVDAVLAGTQTLRVERYGRMLGKDERRRRRAQRGLAPEPLATIVTRSGNLPEIPLLDEPEARVVIFTSGPMNVSGYKAQIEVVALDPGESTLTTVMRELRSAHGVRTLLCEGGPTLFGGLLQEGLVDELFLTLSPKLAGGGTGLTISAGPELAEPSQLQLEWLLERRDSLFLRYRLGEPTEGT